MGETHIVKKCILMVYKNDSWDDDGIYFLKWIYSVYIYNVYILYLYVHIYIYVYIVWAYHGKYHRGLSVLMYIFEASEV